MEAAVTVATDVAAEVPTANSMSATYCELRCQKLIEDETSPVSCSQLTNSRRLSSLVSNKKSSAVSRHHSPPVALPPKSPLPAAAAVEAVHPLLASAAVETLPASAAVETLPASAAVDTLLGWTWKQQLLMVSIGGLNGQPKQIHEMTMVSTVQEAQKDNLKKKVQW
nr:hypothetical protein Iba_chr01aCG12370 [Ipomoea batatas]